MGDHLYQKLGSNFVFGDSLMDKINLSLADIPTATGLTLQPIDAAFEEPGIS
jgi:hypothetical protein